MQFLFFAGNHHDLGKMSLEDIIEIMGNQLAALGHKVVYDPTNEKFVHGSDGMNIMIEGFTPGWIEVMARARANGARFLILATEEPTPKGFNHGTQPEMVKRQQRFGEAAKIAEGIIHLVPGQHVTDWYGQFGSPAAYAELGYSPTMLRIDGTEPQFDFGFYGSYTTRRARICKKLARLTMNVKAVKLVTDFKTRPERDAEMRKAKVIVQIRKFEEMGLVSSSRCCTALQLGRPVIAEPHDLSKPWDEVVTFTKTEDEFYATCLLAARMWKTYYRQQIVAFKNKLSPEVCIGQALHKLGIVEPQIRLSA